MAQCVSVGGCQRWDAGRLESLVEIPLAVVEHRSRPRFYVRDLESRHGNEADVAIVRRLGDECPDRLLGEDVARKISSGVLTYVSDLDRRRLIYEFSGYREVTSAVVREMPLVLGGVDVWRPSLTR